MSAETPAGKSATADKPGFDGGELAAWSGGRWEPGPPALSGVVVNDSRKVVPGAVYLALAGERFDGHSFVAGARAAGACGAIVREGWARDDTPSALPAEFPLLRVADPEAALRAMAMGYRRKLGPHCIGITGSAGKTTVKEFTANVLATRYVTARSLGNWNNHIGLPLSLLAMEGATRMGVFEIGTNHPGEIGPLAAILRPEWGIVTNIGAGHIEFFDSVEAIADEKADLLRALPGDGLAFLNRDLEWFERLRRASRAPVVTISTRGAADFRLVSRGACNETVEAEETATGARFRFGLGLGGEYQVANALFAIAVARRLGVAPAAIEAALAAPRALPMRWQRVELNGVRVVNDAYNANPLSMRAALESFGEEPGVGRKWLVLGGMLELGERAEKEHVALGRDVAAGAWAGLIVVGNLGEWIAQGAGEAGFATGKIYRCVDAAAAARALLAQVAPGDGIMLKASRGSKLEDVLAHWSRMQGT